MFTRSRLLRRIPSRRVKEDVAVTGPERAAPHPVRLIARKIPAEWPTPPTVEKTAG
jgi:hypothetical protein